MEQKPSRRLMMSAIVSLCCVTNGCGPVSPEENLASPELERHEGALAVVNAIDFFRNTTAYPKRYLDPAVSWNQCTPIVSYYEQTNIAIGNQIANRLWYVKTEDGQKWERYGWDSNSIWLERDTSWPEWDGDNSNGYDAKPFGSKLWAANNWQENSQLWFRTYIAGFNYNPAAGETCNYDAPGQKSYPADGFKTFNYYPGLNWGGNIGTADTIAVHFYNPRWRYPGDYQRTETHFYARGHGWVSWEYYGEYGTDVPKRCVWNRFEWSGARTPVSWQCSNMFDWRLPFLGQSTQRSMQYGNWDWCNYKANCKPGEGIQGLSLKPGGAHQSALCTNGKWGSFGADTYTGEYRATLNIDARNDQRRAWRSVNGNSDWDPGYWKLECGADEYVVGVSQNAVLSNCSNTDNRFHAVLCARGNYLSSQCNVRKFNGADDRGTTSSGDWEPGSWKVECGVNEYLAGVSVAPDSGRAHGLLCCTRW